MSKVLKGAMAKILKTQMQNLKKIENYNLRICSLFQSIFSLVHKSLSKQAKSMIFRGVKNPEKLILETPNEVQELIKKMQLRGLKELIIEIHNMLRKKKIPSQNFKKSADELKNSLNYFQLDEGNQGEIANSLEEFLFAAFQVEMEKSGIDYLNSDGNSKLNPKEVRKNRRKIGGKNLIKIQIKKEKVKTMTKQKLKDCLVVKERHKRARDFQMWTVDEMSNEDSVESLSIRLMDSLRVSKNIRIYNFNQNEIKEEDESNEASFAREKIEEGEFVRNRGSLDMKKKEEAGDGAVGEICITQKEPVREVVIKVEKRVESLKRSLDLKSNEDSVKEKSPHLLMKEKKRSVQRSLELKLNGESVKESLDLKSIEVSEKKKSLRLLMSEEIKNSLRKSEASKKSFEKKKLEDSGGKLTNKKSISPVKSDTPQRKSRIRLSKSSETQKSKNKKNEIFSKKKSTRSKINEAISQNKSTASHRMREKIETSKSSISKKIESGKKIKTPISQKQRIRSSAPQMKTSSLSKKYKKTKRSKIRHSLEPLKLFERKQPMKFDEFKKKRKPITPIKGRISNNRSERSSVEKKNKFKEIKKFQYKKSPQEKKLGNLIKVHKRYEKPKIPKIEIKKEKTLTEIIEAIKTSVTHRDHIKQDTPPPSKKIQEIQLKVELKSIRIEEGKVTSVQAGEDSNEAATNSDSSPNKEVSCSSSSSSESNTSRNLEKGKTQKEKIRFYHGKRKSRSYIKINSIDLGSSKQVRKSNCVSPSPTKGKSPERGKIKISKLRNSLKNKINSGEKKIGFRKSVGMDKTTPKSLLLKIPVVKKYNTFKSQKWGFLKNKSYSKPNSNTSSKKNFKERPSFGGRVKTLKYSKTPNNFAKSASPHNKDYALIKIKNYESNKKIQIVEQSKLRESSNSRKRKESSQIDKKEIPKNKVSSVKNIKTGKWETGFFPNSTMKNNIFNPPPKIPKISKKRKKIKENKDQSFSLKNRFGQTQSLAQSPKPRSSAKKRLKSKRNKKKNLAEMKKEIQDLKVSLNKLRKPENELDNSKHLLKKVEVKPSMFDSLTIRKGSLNSMNRRKSIISAKKAEKKRRKNVRENFRGSLAASPKKAKNRKNETLEKIKERSVNSRKKIFGRKKETYFKVKKNKTLKSKKSVSNNKLEDQYRALLKDLKKSTKTKRAKILDVKSREIVKGRGRSDLNKLFSHNSFSNRMNKKHSSKTERGNFSSKMSKKINFKSEEPNDVHQERDSIEISKTLRVMRPSHKHLETSFSKKRIKKRGKFYKQTMDKIKERKSYIG